MSAGVVKLRLYKTRIGGRRGIFRLGRFVLDSAFTWGVPWGQYESWAFIRIKRMAFGMRFVIRLGKPYYKLDVQLLPSRLFHEASSSRPSH